MGSGESYWQTNNIDATSASSTTGHAGAFGIEVSSDGGTTWELYGFVDVGSTASDQINNVVGRIDNGRASTGTLEFRRGLERDQLRRRVLHYRLPGLQLHRHHHLGQPQP